MIYKFLRERLTWILFFVVLQLLVLFTAYIDNSIPFGALLYIVFLSMLLFTAFLFVRYQKETRFYKSLLSWDDTYDLASIASPGSPFEELVMDMLNTQTGRYKRESSQYLARIEEEKDDLMSWIHEVKTPLTTMQLMIDRLDDETMKSQLMYEWLRIHLLLDQQLHQRRIPYIENDLFFEMTELEPIVNKEIKALRSWCLQKGIGFEINLYVSEALTDAKWLGFILRQLLTNAVKYSSGASDILIESGEKNGQTWLSVQDFGRGIDPKDVPRIFDKGFTSTTLHKDSAATGMGLYLAKKAADSLTICIEVNSKPGEGTTFTLIFPKSNEFVRITRSM